MKVIRELRNLKIKEPTVLTIGIFDGVHKGHKRLLSLLKKSAKKINGKSCVVTFEPHPMKILHPRKTPPMLISAEHKLKLLEKEDVNLVILIKFTEKFANTSCDEFIKKTLVDNINLKELIIGRDFVLGKNKTGDFNHLVRLGKKHGFKTHGVKILKLDGRIISSTLIRKLVILGRLTEAQRLLGREVSILGTVTRGNRRGRIMGFPTANINPHHEAIPPDGVYAVIVHLGRKRYRGILNIGFRPTFYDSNKEKEPTIEVHIFNFSKDIYGKDVEVMFLKMIRREKKFKDHNSLTRRIKKDCLIAESYFKRKGL